MAGSYTGRVLFINLTTGSIEEESLPERIYRDFIGGLGLGIRILYERMQPNVDPLGPDNMIGFVPGLLTGTRAPMALKCSLVTKSPLTNTWGDSNTGGLFGQELKSAGYDALFFTGASAKPVYLLVQGGRVELRDATHLWGKDTYQTAEIMHREIGDRVRIMRIGPAGESCSLIASCVADQGRVAARSGVGAVMGSKRLKAIAVRGTNQLEIANIRQFNALRRNTLEHLRDVDHLLFIKQLSAIGTCSNTGFLIPAGATPIKNWSLMGEEAFPDHPKINGENIVKYQSRKTGCGGCPINCGGVVNVRDKPYVVTEGRKPEYETIVSFGPMCLNSNVESIIKANDICDRQGIDTISVGTTIAFAMECYEKGIIGKEETGGIELTWGNPSSMIAMLEKITGRQGFGDVLADGVRMAAQRIGKGSEEYAIHVHGQEPPYHDPRFAPILGLNYMSDMAPGRHTPATTSLRLEGDGHLGQYPQIKASEDQDEHERRAKIHALGVTYNQTFSDSGLCLFANTAGCKIPLVEFISAATGWDFTVTEALTAGKRTMTLKQAFNSREGLKAEHFNLPHRIAKPATTGPLVGRNIDFDRLRDSYYGALGWDAATGRPLESTLQELGLTELVGTLA